MDNTYCHENYCETENKKGEKTDYKSLLILGGYAVFLIAMTACLVYGTLQGYYIDPALLM